MHKLALEMKQHQPINTQLIKHNIFEKLKRMCWQSIEVTKTIPKQMNKPILINKRK